MSRNARRQAKMMSRLTAFFRAGQGEPESGPEVDIFFGDDSRQSSPSRPGMGPLLAIGGINVPAEKVGPLGRQLEALCLSRGFPPSEEFKWSPGRELWMRDNLRGQDRQSFFLAVLGILSAAEVGATVVVVDTTYQTASGAMDHETDATYLFLERVEAQCGRGQSEGFVVVDRPPGGRSDEDTFLGRCLEMVQTGTQWVRPERIAHNVVSTPSKLSRLLQAADLVTGSTLAFVAGESEYSPAIFEGVKPLLDRHNDRIGGFGLKIHPDFKYGNLYHWLAGDTFLRKSGTNIRLPSSSYLYSRGPREP